MRRQEAGLKSSGRFFNRDIPWLKECIYSCIVNHVVIWTVLPVFYMALPEIYQNTSGLLFTEFWWIIRVSDGLSAHSMYIYVYICIHIYTSMYMCVYIYVYTHTSFGFTSCFSRKKVNLLQQQKIIFYSNVHEFWTNFDDPSLCLKLL